MYFLELRSSYPLAVKDKTQTQVVENLLEKQLSRTNHNKVASLPSAIDQEEGRPSRRKMDSEECLGCSANSLDEIEEAARRVSQCYIYRMRQSGVADLQIIQGRQSVDLLQFLVNHVVLI